MSKNLLIAFLFAFVLMPSVSSIYAQSAPILYFCERYDSYDGEIGVSDRFTQGFLTVVVKSDYAMGLRDVSIQFDRYDHNSRRFKYYKKFAFTIDPDMKYVYFSKNDESDMSFDEPGFYRVYLLNKSDETIASSLVQIIE